MNAPPRSEPAASSESYNLCPVASPRLAGLSLRLFAKLVRTSGIGSAIMGKIKKDNNMQCVQEFARTLSNYLPLYYPIHHLTRAEEEFHETQNATSLTELLQFQQLEQQQQQISTSSSVIWRHWTCSDYLEAYTTQRVTPLEIVNGLIALIEESEKSSGRVYILPLTEANKAQLREDAAASSARYAAGGNSSFIGCLDGVPITIKDELDVRGFVTTKGTSFIHANEVAPRDCPSVAKFRAEGCLIVGKANQHEIGCGTTGFNLTYGTPENPYRRGHYTGGSSSGSAGAVAAGWVPFSLGTDGGGSVRIPAALCGVVGIKPTFKRIPEDFRFAASVCHAGVLAASLADAAIAYAIVSGPVSEDFQHQSRVQPRVSLHQYITTSKKLSNIRVGVYRAHMNDASPDMIQATEKALEWYVAQGATVVDIELPHLQEIHLAHSITILSEMEQGMSKYYSYASDLSKPQKRQDLVYTQCSPETQISLSLAKSLDAQDFLAAQRVRSYAMDHIETLFRDQIDVLLSPATAQVAPEIQSDVLAYGESNLNQTANLMKYIVHGNFTGIPGLVFPIGYDEQGLPIALQLQAAHWREDLLFYMAKIGEQGLLPQGWNKPEGYHDVRLSDRTLASASSGTESLNI